MYLASTPAEAAATSLPETGAPIDTVERDAGLMVTFQARLDESPSTVRGERRPTLVSTPVAPTLADPPSASRRRRLLTTGSTVLIVNYNAAEEILANSPGAHAPGELEYSSQRPRPRFALGQRPLTRVICPIPGGAPKPHSDT